MSVDEKCEPFMLGWSGSGCDDEPSIECGASDEEDDESGGDMSDRMTCREVLPSRARP